MVEILYDNGMVRNYNVRLSEFETLTSAMRKNELYHIIDTDDKELVQVEVQKVVQVTYKDKEK